MQESLECFASLDSKERRSKGSFELLPFQPGDTGASRPTSLEQKTDNTTPPILPHLKDLTRDTHNIMSIKGDARPQGITSTTPCRAPTSKPWTKHKILGIQQRTKSTTQTSAQRWDGRSRSLFFTPWRSSENTFSQSGTLGKTLYNQTHD